MKSVIYTFLVVCLFSFNYALINSPENALHIGTMFLVLANQSVGFLLIITVEIIYRIFLTVENYAFDATEKSGKFKNYLIDIFHFSFECLTIATFSIILLLTISLKHDKNPLVMWYDFGLYSILISLTVGILISKILKLNFDPIYSSLWIQNSNHLDYGSCMAHQFFYGYLQIILPTTGTSEKRLKELMENYEPSENIKFDCFKIFFLIPKSCFCPTTIVERSRIMEHAKSINEIKQDVAGCLQRVYKNSVYKIKMPTNDIKYVVTEYATPVRTFRCAMLDHSDIFSKYKNQIVEQFHRVLQNNLDEHPECSDYCELIYYNDYDNNGKWRDVGEILLERLQEYQE